MKKNSWEDVVDGIVFSVVLRFCLLIVAFVRVPVIKVIFIAGAVVATLSLYLRFRKDNRHPTRFALTMATTHFAIGVFHITLDRFAQSHWTGAFFMEPILASYMLLIVCMDLALTQIIKRMKKNK